LKWGDSIFKNAFLDANLHKYRSLANSGKFSKEQMAELERIFGIETDGVIQDLKNGVDSDNVKLLMLNQISKFQPVTLLQVPQAYLDSPRGRIMYALKTYQIAQFNAILDEAKRAMEGAKTKAAYMNAAKRVGTLIALLLAAGMTTDALKDFLFGRKVTWGQLTVDNLLKVAMISRYTTWKIRKDGPYAAALNMVAPPYSWIDYIGKDIKKVVTNFENFELKNMESLRVLPVIGQEWYWWFGGGRAKQEAREKKENPKGIKTNKLGQGVQKQKLQGEGVR
jgi:hypothetical protein